MHDLMERGELEKIGGISAVMDLHAKAIPGLGLERFGRTLQQHTRGRQAYRVGSAIVQELATSGLNGNAPAIAAMAQELIALSDGVRPDGRTIVDVGDLPSVFAVDEQITYIREPELPECAVIALTGASGDGKSTVATAFIRDALAAGHPALVLDRENPRVVVTDRLRRLGLGDHPSLKWWGGWTGEVAGPDTAAVRRWVESCAIRPIVLVDGLSAFMQGDENSAADMRAFMNGPRLLAHLGGTVIVLHHSGKSETSLDYRGSSDFKGNFDQAFHVSNLGGDNRLDRLTLRCFKSRYGLVGSQIYRYADGAMIRDERPDAPARTEADRLTDLLRTNPMATGNKFEKLAFQQGIGRNVARNFLLNGVRPEVGMVEFETVGRAKKYFLRSE